MGASIWYLKGANMFTDHQKSQLTAKLDLTHVKAREQGGREVHYIEGWHAIAEANRIFGFDKWDRETAEFRVVSERERKIGKAQKDGWGVTYIAKVRITVDGIVREGCGSGHGIDVDLGAAHESALKEAETDAMKRALMTFGNPFGLALYDKQQNGVEKPQPKPKMTIDDWANLIKEQINELTDRASLDLFVKNNQKSFDKCSKDNPDIYNGIAALLQQKRESFKVVMA